MFNNLKLKIQTRFKELADSGKLFYVEINRDTIWEKYLEGFTDPVEKQDHNCNCCKSFLRQYAGIVSIKDNKVQSIWDIEADELYALSIKNLKQYIHSLSVTDVYFNSFDKLGTDKNIDKIKTVTWSHFYTVLPKQYVHKGSDSIESKQSDLRANKEVLKRSLEELTIDTSETVLDLIAQNSLYKGKEFEGIITEFLKLQKEYQKVPANLKDNFAWIKSTEVNQALTRIRNTAIGTLLIDLSTGLDLDAAVRKFEAVVAPSNYKRPTALVTPRMIEDAKVKLNDAGLLESLERRCATPTDLNIKDVLFIDKSSNLKDVFEEMKKDTEVNPKTFSKIEEISIEDFIKNVVPKAKAIGVLLENKHLNNMTTLVTAVDKDAPLLFKWNNPFSWSYTGGITDSIKERVKAAGGKVDGYLRVSLSWFNLDDLDLHITEPSKNRICFSNKSNIYTTGQLDVDMNAGGMSSRNAVENIVWTDKNKILEGVYTVQVNNYNKRETNDPGFSIQIEYNGEIFDFESKNSPNNGSSTTVVSFEYSRLKGLTLTKDGKSSVLTKDKWGLKTNRFHKVKNVMLSPNHWDGSVGNKHYMFMLENCVSDETTRPFFNEFLKEEFTPNRKFFEVLGTKLKITPPENQLSGIGFSDTQKNHLIVQVDGSFKRTLKVNF